MIVIFKTAGFHFQPEQDIADAKVMSFIDSILLKTEFTQLPNNRNPLHYYAMFGSMNPIGYYFRRADNSGQLASQWAQMDVVGFCPLDYFFLYVDEVFPPKHF